MSHHVWASVVRSHFLSSKFPLKSTAVQQLMRFQGVTVCFFREPASRQLPAGLRQTMKYSLWLQQLFHPSGPGAKRNTNKWVQRGRQSRNNSGDSHSCALGQCPVTSQNPDSKGWNHSWPMGCSSYSVQMKLHSLEPQEVGKRKGPCQEKTGCQIKFDRWDIF